MKSAKPAKPANESKRRKASRDSVYQTLHAMLGRTNQILFIVLRAKLTMVVAVGGGQRRVKIRHAMSCCGSTSFASSPAVFRCVSHIDDNGVALPLRIEPARLVVRRWPWSCCSKKKNGQCIGLGLLVEKSIGLATEGCRFFFQQQR